MTKQFFLFLFLFCDLLFHHCQILVAQEKDYETAYKKAIDYFNQENKDEGFKYLNQAIGINPSFYDALYARSFYFMQEEAYNNALIDYNLLISLREDSSSLYLYRGQAKLHLERYSEAEEDYLIAYELDSNNIDITNSLGGLYFVLGLYEDAKKYFDKSRQINPQDMFSHYYEAYIYYQQKKYSEAANAIQGCLKLDGEHIDTYRLQIMLYIAQKKYKSTLEVFDLLQKKKVEFEVEDFFYWGLAYYQQKKYKDALFYFELPEQHDHGDIYYYSGLTYYQLKQSKQALVYLNKAIPLYDSLSEESAPLFYNRSVVKYRLRDLKGAQKDFFYAAYLMPEIAYQKNYEGEKLYLLGNAYIMLKMEEKKELLDSIQLQGFQDRADAFISTGEVNKAWAETEKAIRLDSSHSYTYTLRGIIHALMGEYQKANNDLHKASTLEKGQDEERNYYMKGLVYKELGIPEEAKNNILKAIKLNEQTANYFMDLASIEYSLENYPAALKYAQKGIALDSLEIEYYNDRALYYSANSQFKKALTDCNKVLKKDKENTLGYYNRGIAYRGLKNYKKALEDFEKILTILPEEEEVKALKNEMEQQLKKKE